jgi:hypothetical protein
MSDAFTELLEFCKESNAIISEDIGFKYSEESGFGVVSTNEIDVGQTLITVPYSLCISVTAIINHPQLSTIFADNPGILSYPDEVLAIGLMHAMLLLEKKNASIELTKEEESQCFWLNHIQTMPTTFQTPIFWSSQELDVFKFHNVFHLTQLLKRQLQVDFEQIHRALHDQYPIILGGMNFEHYLWAMSIVYSRALDISRNTNNNHTDSERIIVPILDLVNHHPFLGKESGLELDESRDPTSTDAHSQSRDRHHYAPHDTFVYDTETDSIQLRAGRSYTINEEIYAVYGYYCNAKLLYSYGFVIQPYQCNPYQAIDVVTKLVSTTPGYTWKQQVVNSVPGLSRLGREYDFSGTLRSINNHRPSTATTTTSTSSEVHISEDLIAMVRLIQCSEDDYHRLQQSDYSNNSNNYDYLYSRVSLANEMKSNRALYELFMKRAHVEDAQREKEELGALLLIQGEEGVEQHTQSQQRRLQALSIICEERELLLAATRQLDREYAILQAEVVEVGKAVIEDDI